MFRNYVRLAVWLIGMGAIMNNLKGQSYTISGYVETVGGKEPMTGVSVYDSLSQRGIQTNTYGFFSLTLPKGPVILKTRFVSFKSNRASFQLQNDTLIQFELAPLSLDEIEIVAEKQKETHELGRIQIPIEQLKQVPPLMGEVDILKALALTAGVSTGVEGTSGLLVRGGSPDQNLLLLDGSPVYNASHLFGFLSVFNSDAIRQVDLYKGNFPARFGGRLSSVVDIRLKEGNQTKEKGTASVGLISSKFLREGPINDQTSYLFSARSSYLGLFLLPVYLSYRSGGADAYFNYWLVDVNGKINHRFKDGSQLFFSTYGGQDFWRAGDGRPQNGSSIFGLDWGNQTATLRYNRLLSDKLFMQNQLTYSRYQYRIKTSEKAPAGQNDLKDNSFISRSHVRDWAINTQFDYYPVPSHEIKFGVTGTYHHFSPGKLDLRGDIDTTIADAPIPAYEGGIFLEDRMKILPFWHLNLGFRYSGFAVSDTAYFNPEPRLSTEIRFPANIQLSLGYAKMNQYLHLLSNNGVGLPNDIWVPPTDKVPPQKAILWSAGLAQTIRGIEWSVEGYYKQLSGLIDYRQGIDFATSINTNWQELVEINGEGTAYGIETMIRKPEGRLNGWIAYTYSKNQRKFANINNGTAYPGNFDRRHDISITGAYQLNDYWSLSLAWQFQSGRPVTLPVAIEKAHNNTNSSRETFILIYKGRNQSRMPDFHRLDVSATFYPDGNDHSRSWSFGVNNAYNRKNPFFLDLRRTEKYNLIQWSLIPFLPWLSYQWEF